MAAKKKSVKKNKTDGNSTEPKFPYTNKPGSLRKLLKEIPKKPRPTKFDQDLLRSWGFRDANDYSIVRVLKAVGLLNEKNEPTECYSQFMNLNVGAKALGPEIKRVYAPMFQASHTPYNEDSDKLKNIFNIHSGGSERTLDHQVLTFKALCDNASFDQGDPLVAANGLGPLKPQSPLGVSSGTDVPAAIHINLHIHLPENKSRRDYENIIEDIGRHIFGRKNGTGDV